MLRQICNFSVSAARKCGQQQFATYKLRVQDAKVLPSCALYTTVFTRALATDSMPPVHKDIIHKMVKEDKVVVFMKGSPDDPGGVRSGKIIKLLESYGLKYTAHNVLSDSALFEGLKKYTDWPSTPQLFLGGRFMGSYEMVEEMHRKGDLRQTLKKIGALK